MKPPIPKPKPSWAGCLLWLSSAALGVAQTITTGFESTTWAADGGYSSAVEVTSSVSQFQLAQGATGVSASGGLRANMPLALTTTSRRSGSVRKQITSTAAASASLGSFETSIVISPRELDEIATGSRTGELRLGFSSDTGNPSTSADGARSYLEASSIAVKLVAVHDNTATNNRKLTVTLHNSSSSAFSGSTLTQNDATALFNDYLKLTLTIQRGTGNTYTASYRVDDLGLDGAATPTAVSGLSLASPLALTNSNLGAATSIYGAFVASGLTSPNTATTVKAALLLDDYSFTTTPVVPDAAVASAATAVTTTNLTANWQAPATGLNPQGYVLELTKQSDNFAPDTFISATGVTGQAAGISLASTVTTQVFSGLERGVSYVYRLRSTNAAGASVNSNTTTVSTSSVNLLPTLNALAAQPSIYPGVTTPVNVALSGISNGGDVGQVVTVTATSDNTAVVPDPVVTYTNPAATGTLVFTPTGTAGTAVITVSASDGEDTVTRTFVVRVRTPQSNLGFDTEEDYNGEFVHAVSSTSITAAWNATAGIGTPAGAGVLINKTSTSSREAYGYRRQTFNLVNQAYLGTSILINPKDWTGTVALNGSVYVGFLGNTTGAAPSGTTNPLISVSAARSLGAQLNHNAASNQFELLTFNKASTSTGAAVGSAAVVPGASALKSNWLRLSVGFFPTTPGGTTYVAKARLENLGPDGTSAPVLLAVNNQSFTNAAVAALTSAYAAYDVFLASANTGNTYLDNHEAFVNSNVPNAPTALAASVVTKASFIANWSAPTESAYDSYVLEVVGADQEFVPGNFSDAYGFLGNATGIAIPDRETLSFRLSTLDPSTGFKYRVKAVNTSGSSAYSDVVSVTTLPADGNLPPTLDPLPVLSTPVAPDSAAGTVNLTGISDGGEGDQTITVTAVSDNPSVVADPVVSYTDGESVGSFVYKPGFVEGTANITVTVTDGPETQLNRSVSRVFTVIVRQPPVLVGFDSASDLAEFTLAHSGTTQVTETFAPAGGKGSPAEGGLKITSTSSGMNSSGWRKQPYSFVGASSISTSVLINMKEWSASSSKTKFALGFTTAAPGSTTGTDFLGESPGETTSSAFSVGFRLSSNAIEKLRIYNKKVGSSPSKLLDNDPSIAGATLKTHWLKLTLSLIPSGSTTFTASYKLEDVGLTGLDTPVLVYNGGSTVVSDNAALLSASKIYAAYNVFHDEVAGTTYLDDHRAEVVYSLAAPTAKAATTIVSEALTANWTPAANSYYTGYVLEVSKAADNFAADTFVSATGATGQSAGISLPVATTSLRLTGLEPGTEYLYRVRAFNPSVTSANSAPVNVTTLPAGANAAPLLNPLVVAPTVALRTAAYQVGLSGISDGGEGNQTLTVTAVSDNPSVVPDPVVSYTSPSATGSLTYHTVGAGTATITVTVNDGHATNNTVSRSFTLNVGPAKEQWHFDDATDFSPGLQTSATNYTAAWNAAGGIGSPATGGITLTSSASATKAFTAWNPQPYSVPGSLELSTSVLVNMASISLTGELRLGFVTGGIEPGNTVPTTYLSSGTENAVSVSLQSYEKSSAANLQARILNKASTSSASAVNTVSLSRSSAVNQWLRVTLTLTPNGATTFLASYKIEGLGTTGTGTPTLIYALTPVTITNAALANATTAYGAYTFTAGSSEAGSIRFDDYQVRVDGSLPQAPTATEASTVTAVSLRANWVPTSTLVSVTGYVLEVSTAADDFAPGTLISADGTGGQSTGISITGKAVTSLRITNLLPGTAYRYRVRTVVSSSQTIIGQPSNAVDVTTLAEGENSAPTLDAIADTAPVTPYSSLQPLTLTGISDGGEGNQTVTVSAVSDNPAVVPNPTVNYVNPAATAVLSYQTLAAGTANITVTADDGHASNNTVSRTFKVTADASQQKLLFDTESDFTRSLKTAAGNYTPSWVENVGIGSPAGGGVKLTSSASSTKFFTAWKPQAYSVPAASQLTTSVLVKMSAISLTGELRLGFVTGGVAPGDATTSTYLSSGTENAVSVSLQSYEKSSEANLQVRILNKASTSSASAVNTVSLSRSTAVNQWLRVTLTLTPNGASTFLTSYKIEGLGTTGTSTPVTLYSLTPVTITNAALATSVSAYGTVHFTAGSSESGAVYLDEYEVAVQRRTPQMQLVPQPGETPLASGGTLAFEPGTPGVVQTKTVTVKNAGGLTLENIGLQLAGDADFEASISGVTTLPAGAGTEMTVNFTPSAKGNRNADLTLTSNDPDQPSYVIHLTGYVMDPIEIWRERFFGSISNSGDAINGGDADNDGVSNLLEFATDTNPGVENGQPGFLSPALEDGKMVFHYVRSKTALEYGLHFIVEFSDDLASGWSVEGVTQIAENEDETTQNVRAEIPAGNGHRFIRLRVVNP